MDLFQRIQFKAWLRWLLNGEPDGTALEDWLWAEQEVLKEDREARALLEFEYLQTAAEINIIEAFNPGPPPVALEQSAAEKAQALQAVEAEIAEIQQAEQVGAGAYEQAAEEAVDLQPS